MLSGHSRPVRPRMPSCSRSDTALLQVGRRYGAKIEYFRPLTGNTAARPAEAHMRELKRTFPGPLIKNYKFTFMYCYLLEFGGVPSPCSPTRGLVLPAGSVCVFVVQVSIKRLSHHRRRKTHPRGPLSRHCPTAGSSFWTRRPSTPGLFWLMLGPAGDRAQVRCRRRGRGAGYDQGTFTGFY